MSYHAVTWDWYERPARFAAPVSGAQWWNGRLLAAEDLPDPLRFALQPLDETSPNQSPLVPTLFGRTCPVVSQALAQALLDFGVDHAQVFPVELVDPAQPDRPLPGYAALNVVGLVHAADLDRSVYTMNPGGAVIDVAFDELVIDAGAASGLALFRLAEDPSHLWVHDALREHLTGAGFTGLRWWHPSEVASV